MRTWEKPAQDADDDKSDEGQGCLIITTQRQWKTMGAVKYSSMKIKKLFSIIPLVHNRQGCSSVFITHL